MKIKHLREKNMLRQEDVAVQLSVDRSTIAKWETGEAMPRSDKLSELARVLKCEINDLFG